MVVGSNAAGTAAALLDPARDAFTGFGLRPTAYRLAWVTPGAISEPVVVPGSRAGAEPADTSTYAPSSLASQPIIDVEPDGFTRVLWRTRTRYVASSRETALRYDLVESVGRRGGTLRLPAPGRLRSSEATRLAHEQRPRARRRARRRPGRRRRDRSPGPHASRRRSSPDGARSRPPPLRRRRTSRRAGALAPRRPRAGRCHRPPASDPHCLGDPPAARWVPATRVHHPAGRRRRPALPRRRRRAALRGAPALALRGPVAGWITEAFIDDYEGTADPTEIHTMDLRTAAPPDDGVGLWFDGDTPRFARLALARAERSRGSPAVS